MTISILNIKGGLWRTYTETAAHKREDAAVSLSLFLALQIEIKKTESPLCNVPTAGGPSVVRGLFYWDQPGLLQRLHHTAGLAGDHW